jgi:hypothetical protein
MFLLHLSIIRFVLIIIVKKSNVKMIYQCDTH